MKQLSWNLISVTKLGPKLQIPPCQIAAELMQWRNPATTEGRQAEVKAAVDQEVDRTTNQ